MKRLNALLSVLSLVSITACQAPVTSNLTDLSQQQASTSSVDKTKYSSFKNDLWMAQSEARRWDISANLVKAEGTWVDQNGTANWIYYFKSPFKRTAFKCGSVGFGQEVPDSFFGTQISEFDVRVDSNKALELAKAQGLKNFPVSSMTLEKRFGYAEWEIRSLNGIFRINAQNINATENSATKK